MNPGVAEAHHIAETALLRRFIYGINSNVMILQYKAKLGCEIRPAG